MNNGMLLNFDNSCYMDVILFSLLKSDNSIIKNKILNAVIPINSNDDKILINIQSELKNIKVKLKLNEKFNCNTFRGLIKNFKMKNYEDFSDGNPRDADEFLKYLFDIFDINIGYNKQWTYVSEVPLNQPISNNLDVIEVGCTEQKTASPIFDIPSELLMKVGSDKSLKDLLLTVDDSEVDGYIFKEKKYNRIIQYTLPINYELFVINLRRLIIGHNFISNKYIPNEIIKLNNIQTLNLYSIIVWNHGHYTSYIKLDEKYYYYNDINYSLKLIGDYNDLIKIDLILTNGILFFYSI